MAKPALFYAHADAEEICHCMAHRRASNSIAQIYECVQTHIRNTMKREPNKYGKY